MIQKTLTLDARDIGKRYGRPLFAGITRSLHTGESLAVTGPNGSGKSTLLKILCALVPPTAGTVRASEDTAVLAEDAFFAHAGIVLPDAMPHGELTLDEHAECCGRASGGTYEELCRIFALEGLRRSRLERYSSGEMQRAKLVLAFAHSPRFLMLDEPGAFLDDAGFAALAGYIERRRAGSIIVIATNDPRERSLCGGEVRLGG